MTTQEEITTINEGIAAALSDRDVARAVSFFTNDARFLLQGRAIVRGTAEIEAVFREFTSSGPVYTRLETEDVVEDGEVVIDVGNYLDFGPEGPAGPVVDRGKYVGVYRRQGGTLKTVVHVTNTDLSASK